MEDVKVEADGPFFQIGELAKMCGVSPDTLRHYERIGVLPKAVRTSGGYRRYSHATAARVQLVRRALSVGFTLAELARILKIRDSGGAPCHQVRALAAAKLVEVERQVKTLDDLRKTLQGILMDWDQRLDRAPSGSRAGLLEALSNFTSKKESSHEKKTLRRGPNH
jgi:DNA-binding transcriptional MerR regulator